MDRLLKITTKNGTEKVWYNQLKVSFIIWMNGNDPTYNDKESYRLVELFLLDKYAGKIEDSLELACLKQDLSFIKWQIINSYETNINN